MYLQWGSGGEAPEKNLVKNVINPPWLREKMEGGGGIYFTLEGIHDSRQPSAPPFYTLPKNKEKNLAVVHFIFLRTKKKKGTFIRSRMKFSASKKDHEWIVLFVKHLTKSITFLIIAQKIKKTTHYLNDWNKDPPLFRGISQNTKKDLCKKMSVCIIVFDS